MAPLIQLIRGLPEVGQDATLQYGVRSAAPHAMSASLPASQLRAPESTCYSALKCNDFMLGGLLQERGVMRRVVRHHQERADG